MSKLVLLLAFEHVRHAFSDPNMLDSMSWGCILQKYFNKLTLDLSKGTFFHFSFLGLSTYETKVRNVYFHNFLLESEVMLKI